MSEVLPEASPGEPRTGAADPFVGDLDAARQVLRERRRATHAPSPMQVVQDWYVGIFIAATMLTMLFAATGPAILRPDCDTAVCLDPGGYALVALGAAGLGLLAAVAGLRWVGPVSTDPSEATWMVSSPADRGLLLRGRVLRVVGVAVVLAASWGVLVGFAVARGVGSSPAPAVVVIACAAVGALLCVVLVPIALHRQGGAPALRRAARAVPDAELMRAGQVVQAFTAATTMLDTVALEVLASRGQVARRGRHPSRRGAGTGAMAVLVHELWALRRRPVQVLAALITCLGALVAGLLLGRLAGTLLAALAVLAVVRVSAGGLTAWLTAPGLRRALPAHPAAVTAVLAGPPFVLAVVGAAVALAPLGLPWWAPVLLALAATAGGMRACDPPPGLGVALSTPGGAVHVGLVQRLLLGTDLALLGAGAVLMADAVDAGPLVLLAGVALLGWQVLRERD